MIRTLVCLILLLLAAPVPAQVYEWIDENGVKRYSNVAPGEDATKVRKIEEKKTDPSSATQSPSPPPERRSPRPQPDAETPPIPEPQAPQPSASAPPPEQTAESVVRAKRLDIDAFPITQDQLIDMEANRLRQLKARYEELGLSREERIAAERRRLRQAIVDLEKASLDKFGSQDNKRRQVGYYKYRLQDLEETPETYFQSLNGDDDSQ